MNKKWTKLEYAEICRELFIEPTESLLNKIQMFVDLGQQHHQRITEEYIRFIIEDLAPTRVIQYGDERFNKEIVRLINNRKAVLMPLTDRQFSLFIYEDEWITYSTSYEGEAALYFAPDYKDKFFEQDRYESLMSAIDLLSEFNTYPDVNYYSITSSLTDKGFTLDIDLEHSKIEIMKGDTCYGVGLILSI